MKLAPPVSGWRLPRAKPLVPLDRPGQHEVSGASAGVPTSLKAAFIFALVTLTVLDRFGVRMSDSYSANPALFAYYGLVVVMVLTRSAHINAAGALTYVALVTVAGLSFMLNLSLDPRQYASLASLALLLVLYAPFVICIRPTVGTSALWHWMMDWYMVFAVGLAVAGIVQFYAQFVFHAPWLFDYTSFIPQAIRGSGVYNTVNPVGSLIKSNGFFLREASGFSWYMALGLVCEWSLKKRKLVMAVLALALVVSYSGSGLLALGVALLFPLGQRTLLRVLGCVVVGAIVVVVLGDSLNLTYTLGRVGEFDSAATSSSAYCRFIMPGKVAAEQIDSEAWTTLLGHGPGTMQKMFDTCETTYGKVLFEYGLFGAVALAALIVAAVKRSWVPIRIRVVLVVQWLLLGGSLLAPESMLLIFLISALWPQGMGQGAAASSVPDVRAKPSRMWRLGAS
ncbi:MAG: hypothetical protein ABI702_04605 [Burkholderiales bacterium]